MNRAAGSLVLAMAVAAAVPIVPVRTVHATGTTYYVDPTGSDGNAGDSLHPFQHIQQCANVMVAGDTCTINSGTYRETVTPQVSGTASAPITYQAAPGATVTVDGTDYLNGWTQVTDSDVATLALADSRITGSRFANEVHNNHTVYKAHVTLNSALQANQLFANGQMQNEAQWPEPSYDPGTLAATPLTPTVELAGTGTTPTNIADPALTQGTGFWNGAHIYIQQKFTAATGDVTAFQSGNLTVTGYYGTYPDHFDLCEGAGAGDTRFFLWGRITELNAPTEWYYDSTSSTLYFRPASGSMPGTNAVTVKQRPLGFDLSQGPTVMVNGTSIRGVGYTTISGLHLFGTTIQTGDNSTGDNLTSLQVDYPSHMMTISKDPNQTTSSSCDNLSGGDTTTGIMLRGTGNTVQNSVITHSAGNGVALIGSGNTVTNNVIHDVDYSGGRPAGVYLLGDSQTITYNTIYNLGRGGIESNNNFAPAHLQNDNVSYNDIYSYGRLEQDDGAIYVCCNMDMSGTVIHHNWLHDTQTYAGVMDQGTIGVYIDGGTNGKGTGLLKIYCNVGWDNDNGTVGLVTSPVNNTLVLNNDGGVFLSGITSSTGSRIDNNIGDVAQWNGTTQNIVENSDNLQNINVSANNPLYTDEAARDYTLQAGSPAKGTGEIESPGTDGYTGAPSMGAYQYGVTPAWRPGASTQQATVIRPEWGSSSMTSTGSWQNQWAQPIGRMDSHPSNPFAFMSPGTTQNNTGTLHFTFTTPPANGHVIDNVSVLFFARMHRNQPSTTASTTLTMPVIGTVYDSGGLNFERVGNPISVDITSQVAGNWNNIPTSADVSGTLGVESQITTAGNPNYVDIEVYAVEIYIQAH